MFDTVFLTLGVRVVVSGAGEIARGAGTGVGTSSGAASSSLDDDESLKYDTSRSTTWLLYNFFT